MAGGEALMMGCGCLDLTAWKSGEASQRETKRPPASNVATIAVASDTTLVLPEAEDVNLGCCSSEVSAGLPGPRNAGMADGSSALPKFSMVRAGSAGTSGAAGRWD